jgi:uncharacterized protein
MTTARFPDFSRLSLSHKAAIENATRQYLPYSDFNFTSLFSWDDGSTEICFLKNNLVIKLADYITGQPVYSILGQKDIDMCIDSLLSIAGKLCLVPETSVRALTDPSRYFIEEDRDNFDYVYPLRTLAELPGGDFKKKRNKANGFVHSFSDDSLTVKAGSLTETESENVKRIFSQWASMPDKSVEEIRAEQAAIERLLKYSSFFDLYLIEIVLDGEVIAFSINEKLHDGYALCHFEKALPEYHQGNIYTYLSQQTAQKLLDYECKHVNWEQDLGLQGLRKSKLSYHPSDFLKKYFIKPLNAPF